MVGKGGWGRKLTNVGNFVSVILRYERLVNTEPNFLVRWDRTDRE